MPNYPYGIFNYQGRSYVNLVVSEGDAPAGVFIPSYSEAVKFIYAFGPEVGKEVVIPKGKIVSHAGLEWDPETSYYRPALKVANATDIPVGVAPHNVYKRTRDNFSDSETHFLTRSYIQVPAFQTADANVAAAIKFGAAYNADLDALIGKDICADANGNYVLADDAARTAGRVVGTCLDIDQTIPPEGWLQYAFQLDEPQLKALLRAQSNTPSPGIDPTTNFQNWGTFPLGASYLDPLNLMKFWKEGIPFLTDGRFRSRTKVEGMTLDNIQPSTMDATQASALETGTEWASSASAYKKVKKFWTTGSGCSVDDHGIVTVTDPKGAALFIQLDAPIANDALGLGDTIANHPEMGGVPGGQDMTTGSYVGGVRVTFRVDGGATFTDSVVDPKNVHVDYQYGHNLIVVYFTSTVAASKVMVNATLELDRVAGVPTQQDFVGCTGVARILLRR